MTAQIPSGAALPQAAAPEADHPRTTHLTAADVVAIRRARRDGMPLKQLAQRYDVHTSTIYNAACGNTHADVDEPPIVPRSIHHRRPTPQKPCPWFEAAFVGLTWFDARRRLVAPS